VPLRLGALASGLTVRDVSGLWVGPASQSAMGLWVPCEVPQLRSFLGATIENGIMATVVVTPSFRYLFTKSKSIRFQGFTSSSRRFIHIEKRLKDLAITLPPAPTAKANYNLVCYDGSNNNNNNVLYISGHLPVKPDGTLMTGKLGADGRDVAYGYQAARQAGLNIIATLQAQLGDLDRVEQVVKVSSNKEGE
jgi:enamine deaminase RidA (YjgF/YER057c/UK114 family)